MDRVAQNRTSLFRSSKLILFLLCCTPFIVICWRAFSADLGANPVEEIIHFTGIWAIRFILLTLVITPLIQITGKTAILGLRRMLGLFAFFYALLHLFAYVILDQWFDWRAIIEDIVERPYITVGMAAFILMVPLAVTSTQSWKRRLQTRWLYLHRANYLLATLAVVHFWWQVKADVLEPLWYAGLLAGLLVFRLYSRWRFVRFMAINSD